MFFEHLHGMNNDVFVKTTILSLEIWKFQLSILLLLIIQLYGGRITAHVIDLGSLVWTRWITAVD